MTKTELQVSQSSDSNIQMTLSELIEDLSELSLDWGKLHTLKMKYGPEYVKRYCGDCGMDITDSQYGLICGNCRLQV